MTERDRVKELEDKLEGCEEFIEAQRDFIRSMGNDFHDVMLTHKGPFETCSMKTCSIIHKVLEEKPLAVSVAKAEAALKQAATEASHE